MKSLRIISEFYFMPAPVSKEEGEDIDAGVGENNGE